MVNWSQNPPLVQTDPGDEQPVGGNRHEQPIEQAYNWNMVHPVTVESLITPQSFDRFLEALVLHTAALTRLADLMAEMNNLRTKGDTHE